MCFGVPHVVCQVLRKCLCLFVCGDAVSLWCFEVASPRLVGFPEVFQGIPVLCCALFGVSVFEDLVRSCFSEVFLEFCGEFLCCLPSVFE